MRNYYDILELQCSANEDEIRKAYRKMALKWHPDKNRDEAEKAHNEFLLVQQAYEVLSDPVERRWYDENKDKMVEDGYKDNQVNVVIYTTASCYNGFHDGPMGFYTVYSELFQQLSEEDMQFRSIDDPDAPLFGDSTSDYQEVVQSFYNYWCSYSTRKPYTWNDPCNLKHAYNAYERKKMKQLNKEHQEKMKEARNKEIREKLRERADEIHRLAREKMERDRKESRLQMEGYEEAGWMRTDEEQLKVIEEDAERQFGGTGGGEEDELLFCSSCDKAFRSINAFNNHKRSKKHLSTVLSLMKHLKEMGIEDEEEKEKEKVVMADKGGDVDEDGAGGENSRKAGKKEFPIEGDEGDDCENSEKDNSPQIQAYDHSKEKKKKKKKKGKMVLNAHLNMSDKEDDVGVLEKIGKEAVAEVKIDDNTSEEDRIKKETDTCIPLQDDSTEPFQTKQPTDLHTNLLTHSPTDSIGQSSISVSVSLDPSEPAVSNGREEISAKMNSGQKSQNRTNTFSKSSNLFSCRVCSGTFDTRNKLFQHIKQTGHAVVQAAAAADVVTKKKSKKTKK